MLGGILEEVFPDDMRKLNHTIPPVFCRAGFWRRFFPDDMRKFNRTIPPALELALIILSALRGQV